MHSKVKLVPAGQASISAAWSDALLAEAPELTWFRSPAQALAEIYRSTIEFDRYELGVWRAEGELPVGGAIAVPEYDEHVGLCLSVQWRFVEPAHRGYAGRVLHRAVLNLAAQLEIPVVAYTRRVGLGRYELRYIRT